MKVCSFAGCGRPHQSKGWCTSHYWQARQGRGMTPVQSVRDVTVRDALGRKWCARCELWEHESRFRGASHTSDRLTSWCGLCIQSRNHGMTRFDYELLLAEQGGVCALCEGISRDGKALHIDHDHDCCPGSKSCGKCVRGLLCDGCNRGLGHFNDRHDLLDRAATYVFTRKALI